MPFWIRMWRPDTCPSPLKHYRIRKKPGSALGAVRFHSYPIPMIIGTRVDWIDIATEAPEIILLDVS